MSTMLCKNIRFSKILNFHLYNSLTRNYHHVQHCRLYQKISGIKKYSSAAFNYAVKEDTIARNKEKNKNPLENSLRNINWIVQLNGRVLMKDVNKALDLVNSKNATNIHGLYLLRSCKYVISEPPSNRVELVNKIWNRFQEMGIKFDVRHYNALLDVHVCNNFKFNPTEILNSMEEQHIEPNKTTCLLLMSKYCKDGNLSGASEILEYMKEKGLPANEDVFNHLIEGHLNNKDFSGATDLIEVMYSSNLKPSEETYTLLASGFAANGDKDKMMSFLNGKQTDGIIVSDRNMLKVIEALASSGNPKYVDDVLSFIRNPYEIHQEIINSAVELVHKDCIDAAYKLVLSITDSQFDQGAIIFIKQLIKTKKPVSQVLNFCNDIFQKFHNNAIFINATKAAIGYGYIDCAIPLFKEQLAHGFPVRCSNFLPIFSYLKETKDSKKVWAVLKNMHEIGIPADFVFYIDHIFPALGMPEPQDVIQNVKRSNQSEQTACDALFTYYCSLGEFERALRLVETVPVSISQKLNFKSFLNKSGISMNPKHYLKLLKYILHNFELFGQQHNTEIIKGKYLATLILMKPTIFEDLLRHEHISVSKTALNVCEELLIDQKPASLILLRKLKSRNSETMNLSITDEQQQMEHLKGQKSEYKAFLTERLFHHIRIKNIDRVSELLSLYEQNEFTYNPLLLAQLVSMYSFAADLEKTKEAFSKLKDFPSFKLDVTKIFEYAAFLTKYTEYQEALDVLKDCLTEPYQLSNKDAALRVMKQFFAVACETQDADFVKNIHKLSIPLSKVIGSKNVFFDPLVNVHISKNDLKTAFEEYKACLVNYGIPASLNNLLRKCINMNDKVTLQKVIDVTINYSGRNFTLVELSLAFIQTNNYLKAVSVIQNLSHEADSTIPEEICERLRHQNKLIELEQFIDALKSLTYIDKKKLCLSVFKLCEDRNDFNRAVNMFNKYGDDIEPDSEIVHCVISLLEKNNQPIPAYIQSKISGTTTHQSDVITKYTEALIKYIEEENAQMALEELNGLKKGLIRSLSSETLTDIVDICLKKECVKNLSSNSNVMTYIIENARNVLLPILEKYSAAGDVEKLILLASIFPDFSLKNIGFSSHFAKAFINRNEPENLLFHLEERCESNEKLFSMAAFEELLKYPELEDRVLQLSVKYLDVDFPLPITVVWAHFFTKENYNKADELFTIFMEKTNRTFPVDRVDHKIIRVIRQNGNVDLGRKYIDFLKKIASKERVKERGYGTLLDVLVLNGKYDDAVALVLESENINLSLHKNYCSILLTLKNALEKENKTVPFNIPSENLIQDNTLNS